MTNQTLRERLDSATTGIGWVLICMAAGYGAVSLYLQSHRYSMGGDTISYIRDVPAHAYSL